MRPGLYACYECHRVVHTHVKHTSIGNIVLPVAHRQENGTGCPGETGEAIELWDPDHLLGHAR